jgi:hypothetical protein
MNVPLRRQRVALFRLAPLHEVTINATHPASAFECTT